MAGVHLGLWQLGGLFLVFVFVSSWGAIMLSRSGSSMQLPSSFLDLLPSSVFGFARPSLTLQTSDFRFQAKQQQIQQQQGRAKRPTAPGPRPRPRATATARPLSRHTCGCGVWLAGWLAWAWSLGLGCVLRCVLCAVCGFEVEVVLDHAGF